MLFIEGLEKQYFCLGKMNISSDLLWTDLIPLMRGPKETWEMKQNEDMTSPSYG